MRVLMTRKSCAVGMRNAILRNYLKIEEGNPLTLEGYKFTTDRLAGVVVSVNSGECQCC